MENKRLFDDKVEVKVEIDESRAPYLDLNSVCGLPCSKSSAYRSIGKFKFFFLWLSQGFLTSKFAFIIITSNKFF